MRETNLSDFKTINKFEQHFMYGTTMWKVIKNYS